MTNEQEKQMRRVFPNGWEENDIPAFWREEYFKEEMDQLEAEERRLEDLEREEFFNK